MSNIKLITPADIQPVVAETLRKIQIVCPDAVVAGGYLRDMEHGVPFKDIDVFFGTHFDIFERTVKDILNVLDRPRQSEAFTQDYTHYRAWNGDLVGLCDIHYMALPFQLIGLDRQITSSVACERMDMGLCKIAYDGNTIYRSPHYLEDRQAHQFSVREEYLTVLPFFSSENDDRREIALNRSKKRWERLSEKYPSYPLVVTNSDRHITSLESPSYDIS